MDNELLMKLVNGEPVSDTDIENELYELCCRVHSSCTDECPVFEKNGDAVGTHKPYDENSGCDCFKDGKAMLDFLRDTDKKGSGWPHWHTDRYRQEVLLEVHENETYQMYNSGNGEKVDSGFGQWPYPWPIDETRYPRISDEQAQKIVGEQ